MIRSLRLTSLAALALALGACGQDKKAAETHTAQGEVLPGSASDAMLPLDSVRSQPPLAPIATASGKPGAKGKADEAADGAEPGEEEDGAAAPTPAAAPSITTEAVQ